jgi:Ran GTPase-activating protein 1
MSSSKSFSILGKNLKANSKADLEPFLSELEALDNVEEVHFGGNSLGVEACQAIAEVLKVKKSLKVSGCTSSGCCCSCAKTARMSQNAA